MDPAVAVASFQDFTLPNAICGELRPSCCGCLISQNQLTPNTGQVQHLDQDANNPGILETPLPFKVSIKPRSQKHVEQIVREKNAVLDFLQQYD